MRITAIEIQTGEGAVKLANFIEVDPTAAEAPDAFCELAIMLWDRARSRERQGSTVRITQIEIQTDEGARTVKLANFIEVDPTAAEAPTVYCELAIMLWECVRRAAAAQGRLTPEGQEPS